MVDVNKIKEGDKVHYKPRENCISLLIQNGIVKSKHLHNKEVLFVVKGIPNDWENFRDYKAELIEIKYLYYDWYYKKPIKTMATTKKLLQKEVDRLIDAEVLDLDTLITALFNYFNTDKLKGFIKHIKSEAGVVDEDINDYIKMG